MKDFDGFYSFNSLAWPSELQLTSSMEYYLEMICRLVDNGAVVQINELARLLHVKSSSASKMVTNLKAMELVNFEPYSNVQPTSLGFLIENYLLYRHQCVHQFLCLLNDSSDELRQAEKIEHFMNKNKIINLYLLIEKDIW